MAELTLPNPGLRQAQVLVAFGCGVWREIRQRIKTIRGVQVMLDRDLAELYGVETKALNQAVKRNADRFPPDFMVQLTKEECLRSTYGYARVSSADQNEARQIVALTDAGSDFRENVCAACNPK